MAKSTSYKGYSKLADKLSRNSHFQAEEVEALLNMYESVVGSGKMDGNRFRDILHGIFGLTDEVMLERVYQVFDREQNGIITEEEFISGLSTFLRGNLGEKIEYCFNVYDHNADFVVSRDEILQQLKLSIVNVPPGEELQEVAKDLAELVIRKLDDDKDGRVSYEDYVASVTAEPLLLEVLGSCLPEAIARDKFLSTFMDDFGRKTA